jgi:hypothetical protein
MPPKIAKKGTLSQTKLAIANTQAGSQPDAETQVDANTQVDADIPSSSANSNAVDDAMASTANGAAASTADTAHTSADEAETKPAAKRPAGKSIAAATDKKDGEGKKKRRRKPDLSSFKLYILTGLSTCLIIVLPVFIEADSHILQSNSRFILAARSRRMPCRS